VSARCGFFAAEGVLGLLAAGHHLRRGRACRDDAGRSDITVRTRAAATAALTAIFPPSSVSRRPRRASLASRRGWGGGSLSTGSHRRLQSARLLVTGSVSRRRSGLCEEGKEMLTNAASPMSRWRRPRYVDSTSVRSETRQYIFAAASLGLYRRYDSSSVAAKDRLAGENLKMRSTAPGPSPAYSSGTTRRRWRRGRSETEDGMVSAATSSSARSGRGTETTSARPTTRSGAGRRWAPSTTGCAARSLRISPTGVSPRSARTCRRRSHHPARPAAPCLRPAGQAGRLRVPAAAPGLGNSNRPSAKISPKAVTTRQACLSDTLSDPVGYR
jgi:hypothetical protein